MNKTLTEEDLLDLKKEIEDAKTNTTLLEGQKTELMRQLKETYDCNTIKEAEEKLEKLQKRIDRISEQITEGIVELQEKYLTEEEEE